MFPLKVRCIFRHGITYGQTFTMKIAMFYTSINYNLFIKENVWHKYRNVSLIISHSKSMFLFSDRGRNSTTILRNIQALKAPSAFVRRK